MNDTAEKSLYLYLTTMEKRVQSLDARVRTAEQLLKSQQPSIHLDYLEALRKTAYQQPSIEESSLEMYRKEIFPENQE